MGHNPLGTDNTALLDNVSVVFTPVTDFDGVGNFTTDTPGRSANGVWEYCYLPDAKGLSDPAAAFVPTMW